jgi:TRAP-type C4-dicarboxylate transport system permease small subunit
MRALGRIVGGCRTTLLVVSAIGVFLSMIVGTADVVGTQLFLSPLHGATEGIAELMVIIVFLAVPHVQRSRANIRVELLYSRFGPRTQAALDAVAAVAGLAFFGLVFWQGLARRRSAGGSRKHDELRPHPHLPREVRHPRRRGAP